MKNIKKEAELIPENKEQEYLDGWKRALADLENVKKRMADGASMQRNTITRDIVESFLSLADNFRSLVQHAPQEKNAWIEGVLHVARQFDQTLQGFGVTMIEDTGKAFDPAIHEAVGEVKAEEKDKIGTVTEVVQVGYKIGDMTIRPAKVKIVGNDKQ